MLDARGATPLVQLARRVCRVVERSFDHLIRPLQERRGDGQAERLRGLEVDNQFERSGLLDGQVGGPGALENLVDVASGTSLHLGSIYSIGHEAAWLNKHLELIDCGDPMRGRKIDDGLSMHEHKGWRHHHYSLVVILFHAEESGSQVLRSTHDERMDLYAEAPSRDSYLFTIPSAYLGEYRGCDILSKERGL